MPRERFSRQSRFLKTFVLHADWQAAYTIEGRFSQSEIESSRKPASRLSSSFIFSLATYRSPQSERKTNAETEA